MSPSCLYSSDRSYALGVNKRQADANYILMRSNSCVGMQSSFAIPLRRDPLKAAVTSIGPGLAVGVCVPSAQCLREEEQVVSECCGPVLSA